MNATWFEERGWRESLLKLLKDRFGPLPSVVVAQVEGLGLERLRALQMMALKAQSLNDLGLDD
jgi:Domain of unknown function (DUF4351)